MSDRRVQHDAHAANFDHVGQLATARISVAAFEQAAANHLRLNFCCAARRLLRSLRYR
jgi:hypothetical protein